MKHKSKVLFSKDKLRDFIVLITLFFLGIIVVYFIKPSYIVNLLIVYLPGIAYILYLVKNSRKKIILFTLLAVLFIIPVEVIARMSNSWDVLSQFPRILDLAPVENMVYALVNIIYPIAFYEYFYDGDRNSEISKNWKYLLFMYLGLCFVVFPIVYLNNIIIPYWLIGIVIYLPIIILFLIFKKHIFKRLFVIAITFGLMFGIHEILSMALGHWWWPGEYLMPITVYGYIYPLDDVVIWLLLSNMAVICGYEVMWD